MKKHRGLITAHIAGGALAKYRIGKFGASDDLVVQGAAATDLLIGVTTDIPAVQGDTVDLVRSGITPVEYGGNVTRGQKLTSDADGKAVAITLPVATASVQVIGTAEVSGASGDIGSVAIAPHQIYGGPA